MKLGLGADAVIERKVSGAEVESGGLGGRSAFGGFSAVFDWIGLGLNSGDAIVEGARLAIGIGKEVFERYIFLPCVG